LYLNTFHINMETLTIEIPDKETKIVKEILKKFNVKIIKTEGTETPNALTIKTIKDAQNGKGIEGPIENIRSFINSI
jgi:hypothetical protein